jgi:hypothetical protein
MLQAHFVGFLVRNELQDAFAKGEKKCKGEQIAEKQDRTKREGNEM